MPEISAVGILRQEDCQFETNLGYIQKKKNLSKTKNKNKKPRLKNKVESKEQHPRLSPYTRLTKQTQKLQIGFTRV